MTEHFQNLPIDIDNLPKVEEVNFQHIDKKYLNVSLIGSAIFFFLLAIGGFAILYFGDETTNLGIIMTASVYLLLLVWNLTLTILGFKKKKYALRDRDILYTKGLIWSVRTAIPFNRIQHAEIKQGPLERKFGLSSLKVFTAGGQSSDLVIPGLPNETAQQLKDFILKKTTDDGEQSV